MSETQTDTSVLSGKSWKAWWFVLPLIGSPIAMLLGGLLAWMGNAVSNVCFLFAIVCMFWAILSGFRIWLSRSWVRTEPDGFSIGRGPGRKSYSDSQIRQLAVYDVDRRWAGSVVGFARICRLRLEVERQPKEVSLEFDADACDMEQADELIEKWCSRLSDAARRTLRGEGVIQGSGWELSQSALIVTNRRFRTEVAVPEISAVQAISDEVRIWRKGQAEPIASIPIRTQSAWLVHRLLTGILSQRKETVEPHIGIGRLLFERRAGWELTVLFTVFSFLFLAATILLLWSAVKTGDGIIALVGINTAILTGVCCWLMLRSRRLRFRGYENGVQMRNIRGETQLLFDDMDVFSYDARRQFNHGRYTGTLLTIVFGCLKESGHPGIFYSTSLPHETDDLQLLRDRAAEALARRMAKSYGVARRIQWTPELWLCSEFLEYRQRGWFGSKSPPTVVHYRSITDFNIEDGWFCLWAEFRDRAVIKVRTSSPNFYAGMILLESLSRQAQSSRTSSDMNGETSAPARDSTFQRQG